MIDFLTHPHHRHTQGFAWLKEAIGQPTRTLYGDPETLRDYLPSLRTNPPRLLILFQLEHLAAWASCFCPVLVFPMYDLTRLTPDAYLASLQEVEWLSFSRALHQRLAGLGLSSQYLQYAPDPADYPVVSWKDGAKGYFWERTPEELDARAAGKLLRGLGVESLEVRSLGDANFSLANQRQGEQPKDAWVDRDAYLHFLARFNVYVAPRRYEGIGMTFLEAMAMGMCVVAENQPTANEYIVSGHNGILYEGDAYRLFPLHRVAVGQLEEMGRQARETTRQSHLRWVADRGEIGRRIESLLSRPNPRRLPMSGLLEATLDFWPNQSRLWGLCGAGSPIWRSAFLEALYKREVGLFGRLRSFWRRTRSF